MNIKEILALDDVNKKIELLKKRKTPAPNSEELIRDWNPSLHDVMNPEIRKDSKVLKKAEYTDERGIAHPAEYETEKVNRISLPIEQDIVNIHTAFTVGTEPKTTCETEDKKEKELFSIVKTIYRKNKMRFNNKRIVRSWLSEQEVAEYWYVVNDEGFWSSIMSRIRKKIGLKSPANKRLKCTIWSPFRGDSLYPFFDDSGDMVAFSREYKVKDENDNEITKFMTLHDKSVTVWKNTNGWVLDEPNCFTHDFPKLPVIYSYSPEALCKSIKPIRVRWEELLSNYADCIDRHFFPYLILEGEVEGAPQKVGKNRMIKIENKGKVYYLDWNQTPEAIKLELETLREEAYSLTNTPRISFENMKGLGSVPSGTAFKYTFMGMHLAVDNHAETIGEHLQRRDNFVVSAIGAINAEYASASKTIDIETEIVPFTLESLKEKIEEAVAATGGPIASLKTGVIMAGLVDEYAEEVELIKLEQDIKTKYKTLKNGNVVN